MVAAAPEAETVGTRDACPYQLPTANCQLIWNVIIGSGRKCREGQTAVFGPNGELKGIEQWVPKFYPQVLKQYQATCAGSRDLFF